MKITDMTKYWKLLAARLGCGLVLLACAPVYAQQLSQQDGQPDVQQTVQQNVQPEGRQHPRRFPRFFRQMPVEPGQAMPIPLPLPPEARPNEVPPGMPERFRAMRLTPEQRRQLRQDIREHGRDLYRVPPRPWKTQ